MNFLSFLKKKNLPTNQGPTYADNSVKQMVAVIRNSVVFLLVSAKSGVYVKRVIVPL